MNQTRTKKLESAEDVFFGQVVINWARWFLIAAGAFLIVGTSEGTGELALGIMPIIGLMAMNFYLHGRRLAERPANRALILLASLLDVVITLVVLVWSGHRGLSSEFYIAYYPVVLAFAFVMPPKLTAVYTLVAVAAYAAACMVTPGVFFVDGSVTSVLDSGALNVDAAKALLMRVITIAAVGGLGTFYYRKQRDLRRQASRDSGIEPGIASAS